MRVPKTSEHKTIFYVRYREGGGGGVFKLTGNVRYHELRSNFDQPLTKEKTWKGSLSIWQISKYYKLHHHLIARFWVMSQHHQIFGEYHAPPVTLSPYQLVFSAKSPYHPKTVP